MLRASHDIFSGETLVNGRQPVNPFNWRVVRPTPLHQWKRDCPDLAKLSITRLTAIAISDAIHERAFDLRLLEPLPSPPLRDILNTE
jgi:hypothetical protein